MEINPNQPLQPPQKILRPEQIVPIEIKEHIGLPNQPRKETQDSEKQQSDKQQPPSDQLKKDIDAFNKMMESRQTHLKFQMHEKLNEYFVQVVNNQNEVVKEIPPKKLMDMAAKVQEMIGILVDEKI